MSSSALSKSDSVKKMIIKRSRDNRIACAALRKLAEDLGIPYKNAGKAANELKIKIKNCDLGCF